MNQQKEPEEIDVDVMTCPECEHWPLVMSDDDGGDPPVRAPYSYWICLECGYNTAEE